MAATRSPMRRSLVLSVQGPRWMDCGVTSSSTTVVSQSLVGTVVQWDTLPHRGPHGHAERAAGRGQLTVSAAIDIICWYKMIRSSSVVQQTAVNRWVVGSSPTSGANEKASSIEGAFSIVMARSGSEPQGSVDEERSNAGELALTYCEHHREVAEPLPDLRSQRTYA